jgi:hypothetical protein
MDRSTQSSRSQDPDGGSAGVLSDAEIAALSDDQCHDLIRRLQRPAERGVPRQETVQFTRRLRLTIMVGAVLAMIPWLVYLGMTLPEDYHARNWSVAWLGFDILLVLMMTLTAYLGWRRRILLLLPAFGTGLLLVIDAWFDIVTADADDFWASLALALAAELPLALLQISGALLLFRFTVLAHPLHRPGSKPWRAPMPF